MAIIQKQLLIVTVLLGLMHEITTRSQSSFFSTIQLLTDTSTSHYPYYHLKLSDIDIQRTYNALLTFRIDFVITTLPQKV